VDGEPRHLLAGDYPYFRDDPANWEPRLRALAEAGLEVVTCYVPWRHHAPRDPLREGARPDFSGRTQPNRDLVGLLDLCRTLGLRALLKPGPFVHAELPYGGLPDYVDPELNPAIEPELDAEGQPIRWALAGMPPRARRALPAPFGDVYGAYVRTWLQALAREVLLPNLPPEGPLVGLQLMNEGIYSDSANADPRQLGFALSSVRRFHEHLALSYGSIEEYNARHGAAFTRWEEIDPPRRVGLLEDTRALLAYLDWSAFQARMYASAARRYESHLVEAGLPASLPFFFNFNANGRTYRERPASNDGWYTRVAGAAERGHTFGTTSWLGVIVHDRTAFRQYVMATTFSRGPALEQNWGFSTQYDAPYQFETPSHFETMLALACGATGFTAYTFAGTRAWREDANLGGEWHALRTNDRGDETSGDYPGTSPVLSDGTRTRKFWTLRQLSQFLRDEGPRFVAAGPRARVSWGIYPPYAWAGQWLPRGDADDVMWRPPLRTIPRGAYHGLDAFVELLLEEGEGFRQEDVTGKEGFASQVLCVSAHEYMDARTQERLAAHVEDGGGLLLTGIVPSLDERLLPFEGALRGRVFPHRDREDRILAAPTPLRMGEMGLGLALDTACLVEPPADADMHVHLEDAIVGYRRRVGHGQAIFLGVNPWRAELSGDDPYVARANRKLVRALLDRLRGEPSPARPLGAPPGEVHAWEHAQGRLQQIYVVVRDAEGDLRVAYTTPDGDRETLELRSPSGVAHAILLEDGRLRAVYLKGTNDLRGQRVAPRVIVAGDTWGAEAACDLCVTRPAGGGIEVSVAHLGPPETRVFLEGLVDEPVVVGDLSRDGPRRLGAPATAAPSAVATPREP
jgi:beta-galactosidase